MSSDRHITIVLRAKNAMAAGMADARAGIERFRKSVSAMTSNLLGPIAGVTAAFMAVRKAVDGWMSVMRAGDEARAASRLNAISVATTQLQKEYERLTAAIRARNDATKAGQDIQDKEIKAMHDLADANRELAKQKALGALDPADDEGRAAVERQFEVAKSAEDAQRSVEQLRLEQSRLADESKRRANDAAELADQYSKQTEQAKAAAAAATELAASASRASGTGMALFDRGTGSASATDAAKRARDQVDELLKMREKTIADQRAALAESENLAQQAAAAAIALKAAEVAQAAATMREANKDELAEAKRHASEMENVEREAAANRLQQKKDLERAEDQLKRDILAREMAAAQDAIQIERERLAEGKRIAEMRMDDLIAEANIKDEDNKQRERDEKKAQRLRQNLKIGGSLSRKDQQFLDLFNKREIAEMDAANAAGNIAAMEAAMKWQQEDNKTLKDIRTELANTQEMLRELIPMG
jgi:hypothetical protein